MNNYRGNRGRYRGHNNFNYRASGDSRPCFNRDDDGIWGNVNQQNNWRNDAHRETQVNPNTYNQKVTNTASFRGDDFSQNRQPNRRTRKKKGTYAEKNNSWTEDTDRLDDSDKDSVCSSSSSNQSRRLGIFRENEPSKNFIQTHDAVGNVMSWKSGDKIAFLTNFKDILQTVNPFDLIDEYTQNIFDLEKVCSEKHTQRFRKISSATEAASNKGKLILHEHLKIIRKQQKTFSSNMANMKAQLTDAYSFSSKSEVYQKCEEVLDNVKHECKLFKKALPIYAYKEDILSCVAENQVTVISVDSCYSGSESVPFFIHKTYGNGSILSCEPHAAAAILLSQRCKLFEESGLDNLVGYDTEIGSENVQNAKILFASVQKVFNLNSDNHCLLNYLYVILHCELKRSVLTDFLLECLRSCVIESKEFKVILLLSPLDNASKFVQYFSSSASVGTLVTPNIIFPVQTMWKMSSISTNYDYITEVVNTAIAIHALNSEGDVLVFLPSLPDIKKVSMLLSCELVKYNYFDAICVPIHDDSDSVPNLGLPELKSNNKTYKRKFFLTTSTAELLSFPSVIYGIDSGIRKSLTYDQQKCSDLYTETFISRTTAKLRKNWVGGYSSGICYRLYSKQDYLNKMQAHEVPEILCKNPLDVVVKMFQYKPANAMSVNFLESFPEEVKTKSVAMLNNANALNNGKLTALGEQMIKLPYLPRYSQLIIIGIEWGLPLEAIILVAFFLVGKPIFMFDEDNKELQKKVEATKLHYIICESDTLTHLNIYRSWIMNDFKKLWCKERGVEFDVLTEVQSKVNEITSLISSKLKVDVSLDIKLEKGSDWNTLQELLYICFRDNLCVFTGHHRSGYHLIGTNCITFLHPSSSILQKNNLPEFVVYDHLKITSRHYMMGVTSVSNKILSEDEKNNLNFCKDTLLRKKLEPIVIENVGGMLIKHVLLGNKGRKLLQIEDEIRKETECDLIVIEPSEEKGNITLFTPPECSKKAATMVRHYLETKLEAFLKEEETATLELKKGQLKVPLNVTWQKGAVAIKIDVGPHVPGVKSRINQPNESEYEGSSIKYCVQLSWYRRLCKGFGFALFSESDFCFARRLSMRRINVNGEMATVTVNKVKQNQLYISGIPPETSHDDLKVAVNVALRDQMLPEIQVESAHVIYTFCFETSTDEIEKTREELYNSINKLLNLNEFTIFIPKPNEADILMKGFITTDNPVITEQGIETLNKSLKLNDLSVKAKLIYSSSILCSINVFNAVHQRLDSELQLLDRRLRTDCDDLVQNELFSCCVETEESGFVHLKLSTHNKDIMKVLQMLVQKILEGEVVTSDSMKKLHKLFTHGGCLWLRSLEKQEEVFIIDEYKSQVIRLYGSVECCRAACQRIREYLENSENEVVKIIDLSDGMYVRTLMKAVLRKYSFDLKDFVQKFKLRSAEAIIRTSQLVFHGEPDCIEKALCELEHLASNCSPDVEEELTKFQEVCCTCGVPPLQSSFRLEHCGHLYCAECVVGLIKSVKILPISCCAEDCDKELILEDIRKALDYDDNEINDLLKRSMADFVSRHSEHLVYCPAPDCSMFLDKRLASASKVLCKLCQNDICLECNVVYHHGYTCSMYRGTKNDPDFSYKMWLKERNADCRQCPKCHVAIERTFGCDHMTCTSCNAHFCWLCDRLFPNDRSIYRHIPYCQGNRT